MNDVGPETRAGLLGDFRTSALFQQLLAFSGLLVLVIGFSLASKNFLQTANIINVLQATSVNGVLAIAATLVIISGGIDLSVGTLMTFCSVIAGVLLTNLGLPIAVGVPGALISGLIPGLPIPNGVLILFLVGMAAAFILARTALGRFIFALGSNEEALRLSGV